MLLGSRGGEEWLAQAERGQARALGEEDVYELRGLDPEAASSLAERILKGDRCDVFTPSSPAVIEKGLMLKKVAGGESIGASWSVIFSANEMVLITAKGNPREIRKLIDLTKPGIRFSRVTGENDLATKRSIDFVRNVAALEGKPDLAQRIIDGAIGDAAQAHTVPQTIQDVVG
ncbi:MAG: solute-binding protein, partial [Syntrophobacteraceae bacterium]|nr:solute-binding protein [Syntrophobacteraceae bacterium]